MSFSLTSVTSTMCKKEDLWYIIWLLCYISSHLPYVFGCSLFFLWSQTSSDIKIISKETDHTITRTTSHFTLHYTSKRPYYPSLSKISHSYPFKTRLFGLKTKNTRRKLMSSEKENCYVLVGNIPSKFHSVDLRSFFSQFVESGKFQCFHFRHRPEILRRKDERESGQEIPPAINLNQEEPRTLKGKTTCCVVRLKEEHVKELLDVYNDENWIDKDGKLCSQKVVMSTVTVTDLHACKYYCISVYRSGWKIYIKYNLIFHAI